MKTYLIALIGLLVFGLQSCAPDEEVYKELPKAVYFANRPATGAANLTNSASGRRTVPTGVARIYVNQLYDRDVVVNFSIGGTAVAGQDYTPPAAMSVTIPAGKYFGEITFPVLNNPAQTANRTVVFTMTSATEEFALGIGFPRGYFTFTYTITP
ncbi:hypothetical protein [Spirosoma montaniterrae]|uniref:DUF4843 domain-containing protein n=1 Tax=Spirosoma montaniterrae TaxID=1178516 RepID=A0A1P9WV07_9BACT|nr:hypothetical protein [Spirosoma montaniterrae]AQG79189.1 hypothetical protein AWR27_07545 [Spirosoma montaniterrae]